VAQWQAALRAVTYRANAIKANTAPRTVSVSVSDGTVGSAVATRTITVIAPAPRITTVQGPPNGTYRGGQELTVTVVFDHV
jgi:hypothetical protein